MGVVNQLAEFTSDIAATAQSLRPMVNLKRAFIWTTDHGGSLRRVKTTFVRPTILALFDHDRPVILQTDASRLYGLGYPILQDHDNGLLLLVQCGSLFLAVAETHYATTELEMLVVSLVISKRGCTLVDFSLIFMTDHRPLIPILNHYSLDA